MAISENSLPVDQNTDRSFQAEAVVGAGRGGLVLAISGAGWLSWGLVESQGFTGVVGPVFGCIGLLLVGASIYTIRRGRLLRKRYLPIPSATRRAIRGSFLLVFGIEIAAIVLVVALANRLHRNDLAADWCAIVVGLHFVPLAKIFRAPILGGLGVLIVLWSILCWAGFRRNMFLVSVAAGTGILLWAACVSAVLRARAMARSLSNS
jgi:hypothetical protein